MPLTSMYKSNLLEIQVWSACLDNIPIWLEVKIFTEKKN